MLDSRTQHYGRSIPPALGALGVVYGDIGTSPLYTIRECFHGTAAIALDEPNILNFRYATTTYCLGRETLVTTGKAKMMQWRKALFVFMSRNAVTPATFFNLPSNRVVELGAQVEI
jgi:K+ transporter